MPKKTKKAKAERKAKSYVAVGEGQNKRLTWSKSSPTMAELGHAARTEFLHVGRNHIRLSVVTSAVMEGDPGDPCLCMFQGK